ncbi:MAG: peptide-methionine (S)-S-oxide reductase MsrA [Bacteriovoracaceae bacterium]|jgi:peptide-methionine (S)-S-oxide reductase|nr:peptide-methionine (S)-S-oxide reductase MsrA [Bacteriovoracaceae bacterium]
MTKVYLGGGCYWGVEFYFKGLKGVISTSVGFMGGDDTYTSYNEVMLGHTGHAEVVEVEFDENIISLEDILHFFFRLHDPTTLNRQKNDIGTQYRSIIFVKEDEQVKTAKDLIDKIDKLAYFQDKIVTRVELQEKYHKASEYHQDYLTKNPTGYNCHVLGEKIF